MLDLHSLAFAARETMFQLKREDGTVHAEDVLTMLGTVSLPNSVSVLSCMYIVHALQNERIPGIGKEEVHKVRPVLPVTSIYTR